MFGRDFASMQYPSLGRGSVDYGALLLADPHRKD